MQTFRTFTLLLLGAAAAGTAGADPAVPALPPPDYLTRVVDGAHSVPPGLQFYRGNRFPERYRQGAFVARRDGGSRAVLAGFDAVFVPFSDGAPSGAPEPFLDGFMTNDAGNTLWRVTYGAK